MIDLIVIFSGFKRDRERLREREGERDKKRKTSRSNQRERERDIFIVQNSSISKQISFCFKILDNHLCNFILYKVREKSDSICRKRKIQV